MSQFYVPQKSQNQNLVSIRANKKYFKFKKNRYSIKRYFEKVWISHFYPSPPPLSYEYNYTKQNRILIFANLAI